MTEPAHNHQAKEHVYYITKGRGEILLGDEIYEVRDGAAAYIPQRTQHGLINDGDDWIQHLVLSSLY